MTGMTPPASAGTPGSAPTAARRVLLLPVDGRPDEVVRRYRLACLRLDAPAPPQGQDRFAHLKRSYD
jgi:hypothetical protein